MVMHHIAGSFPIHPSYDAKGCFSFGHFDNGRLHVISLIIAFALVFQFFFLELL